MNQGALKQKANPVIIVAALAVVGIFVAILAYATTRSPEVAKPSVVSQMSSTEYRQKMQESMERSKANGGSGFRPSGGYSPPGGGGGYSPPSGSGGYSPPH